MRNWDDYRLLLAVAESGSFTRAARALGVTQPTVTRRITEMEAQLGVELFDRMPDGVRTTEAGGRICSQAHIMRAQAEQIERSVRGIATGSDRVCVAAPEGLSYAVITPLLARFCRENNDTGVDLLISNRPVDILKHEAHVAVRMGDPHADYLVGRRAGCTGLGLFGHERYFEQHGYPGTLDCLENQSIIESTGDLANIPQALWLRENAVAARIAYSSNSIVNQTRALADGVGLLALPVFLAQDMPGIRRVLPQVYSEEIDVWVLTEKRLRERRPVALLIDFLAREISATLSRLSV
ncbi:MAG: LysR family transcriptional regulator [Pseudomonadota bacterium]